MNVNIVGKQQYEICMKTEEARLDEQLCFALYSASSRLTAIYRPILKSLNLTYPQFVVMMALWEQDEISITELASKTGLSKPTMTPLLRNLQEKDYIELLRVPTNERQKCVTTTLQGKELASRGFESAQAAFCASGLTDKQAQTMISLCHKIGNNK